MRRWLRRSLPFAVSAATLAWLFHVIEPGKLLEVLSWRIAAVFVPALIAFGAVTLALDVACLRLLVGRGFPAGVAVRIKCASYLLGIVNYGLGIAALTVLLRRRAGIRLTESASVTVLILSADLAVVLGLGATAAAFVETEGALRSGLLALLVTAYLVALLVLRAPGRLGPLERLRSLTAFAALRRLSLGQLGRLLGLRLVFNACFVAMSASVFYAFGVTPPLATLVAGILVVTVVSALPIAVAGLGTGQAATLFVFQGYAAPETLVAMSLTLAAGLLSLRGAMGLVFAREFSREALSETRAAPA